MGFREREDGYAVFPQARSGERRVGEEGRSRWAPYYLKKKKKKWCTSRSLQDRKPIEFTAAPSTLVFDSIPPSTRKPSRYPTSQPYTSVANCPIVSQSVAI